MKIRITFLVVMLFCFAERVNAQTNLHHIMHDQVTGYDHNISASVLTNDGGVIAVTALSWNPNVADNGISLIRFDSQGNRVWNNFIYGSFNNNTILRSIQENADGSFIIIGNISSQSTAFLIKTDATGNVLFAKTYARASTVIADTIDNGFIITGSGSVPAYPGYRAAYIAKTDSNGNVIWSSNVKIANNENDYFHSAQRLADSSYIVVGSSTNAATISSSAILSHYDKDGVLLWIKGYVTGNMNGFMNVKQMSDGSFLIVGTKETYAPVGSDPSCPILVKTDANGNLAWAKTYDTGNDLFSISYYQYFQTAFSEDAVYVSDMINGVTAPPQNPAILKIDTAGNLLWIRMFSAATSASGIYGIYNLSVKGSRLGFNSIAPLMTMDTTVQTAECYLKDTILTVTSVTPNVYVITPLGIDTTISVTSYTMSVFSNVDFVKMEACGLTGINPAFVRENTISIFPNPANDKLVIHAANYFLQNNLNLELVNVLGQVVKQIPIYAESTTVEIENLAPGIYFYQLYDKKNVTQTGKIIIE